MANSNESFIIHLKGFIALNKMSKFSENQVILIHPEKNLIELGDIHFNIGHPSSKFDFSLEASERCLGI